MHDSFLSAAVMLFVLGTSHEIMRRPVLSFRLEMNIWICKMRIK